MLKNENNIFLEKQIVLMTLGPLSLDGYIEQTNSSGRSQGGLAIPVPLKGLPT